MDRIAKVIPVSQKVLSGPVFFSFNTNFQTHASYNGRQYNGVQEKIRQEGAKAVMSPCITTPSMSLEERGQQMAHKIEKAYMAQEQPQKLHLIGHSFSGVDLRAALSLYGADRFCRSLTTISSPHHGLSFIEQALLQQFSEEPEHVEPVLRALGMSLKNYEEFSKLNMQDFNALAENMPGVCYHSMATRQMRDRVTPLMRHTYDIIHGQFTPLENDGLIVPEDCKWGNYLLTLDSDHLEVIGFNYHYNNLRAIQLAIDNIKVQEAC